MIFNYPKLSLILPLLRERVGGQTVEQVLETLLAESEGDPETKKALASVRFYLCEMLNRVSREWRSRTSGVTNYAPLLRDILRFNRSNEPVCLVTFNYDLLLEQALSTTLEFRDKPPTNQFDSHPIFKLFKLHGSVAWAKVVDAPSGTRMAPAQLIEAADTLAFRPDEYIRADATDSAQMFNHGRPIFPAIAIPVQTKTEDYFECPKSHREYLCELLPSVTKVLIVGWQAREAHFNRILQSTLPALHHVFVVGHDKYDATKILDYFMGAIGQSGNTTVTPYMSPGGFTDFIVDRIGLEFFKA